jgi:uncharacterized protein YdhG (YjbR/CyaY superfamily)
MESNTLPPTSIDEFIAQFPLETQVLLQKIRAVIHEATPEASEVIAYGIPTFVLHGNLVHFSAYKNHIGFYPAPSGIEQFKEALAKYQKGKGTIQFPIDQPIPYDLVREVTLFRAKENERKAAAKKAKK